MSSPSVAKEILSEMKYAPMEERWTRKWNTFPSLRAVTQREELNVVISSGFYLYSEPNGT